MSQMPPLRTIANGQPVDATDPEYNFNTIESHLRLNVINRDGSVAMQAPLILSGPPTQDSHAANKAYVDNVLPPGVMVDYGSDVLPLDFVGIWEVCNGQIISIATPGYDRLRQVIGNRYGGTPGTNFQLPDFRKRVAVGVDATDPLFAIGKTGGTANGVAAHVHTMSAHTHTINHGHTASTGNAGAHGHTAGTDAGNSNHQHWSGPSSSHELYGRPEAIDDVFANVAAPSTQFTGWRTGRFLTEFGGSHTHGVTVNGVGDHAHTATVVAHSGDSGPATAANTGSFGDLVNGNYPLFVTVTKLIRL